MEPEPKPKVMALPDSIISPTDLARLIREIDSIEQFFKSTSIRKPGQSTPMPRSTKLMDLLVESNRLNLLQAEDRAKVRSFLQELSHTAPVVHISFSAEPSGNYIQGIVAWLRKNVHGQVLIKIGLQPNIGAGCIVRTTNKVFDFSLRQYFDEKKAFFVDKLHDAVAADEPAQSVAPQAVVPAPAVATAQPVADGQGVAA